MNATLELPRYEEHLVPATPNANGLYEVGCSDKRAAALGDLALPSTYDQLLGGVEVGQDVATAWEMTNPGEYVYMGITVEELGVVVAAACWAQGIKLVGHEGCAALGNRQAINDSKAAMPIVRSGSTLLRTRAIYGGDVSIDELSTIADASARIKPLVGTTEKATETLKAAGPQDELPEGIGFATLAPTGDARAFVFSRRPGYRFDTRRLTREHPAYISTLHTLDRIHAAVSTVFPSLDKDAFKMAYAARAAVIAENHITQEDGTPYPMYVIDKDGVGQVFSES